MNKYTEMLEKHVQWVALAIGGLWLLFMTWTYVIQAESSTIEVGGQKLGATDVDTFVRDTKAYPLRERIERPDKLPDRVEGYADAVRKQLQVSPDTMPQLADAWVRTPVGSLVEVVGPKVGDAVPLVTDVPKVAKANQIDTVQGRSVVELAPQAGEILPAGVQAVPKMISWVTVFGNIPMQELAKEFDRTVGKQVHQLHLTTLLKVELLREELLPNGQWSKAQTIQSWDLAPQGNQAIPAWPAQNNRAEQMQFAQAMAAQQPVIAQPKFFPQVKRGDLWHKPGELAQQVGMGNPNAPQQPPPEMMPEEAPPAERPRPGPVRPGGTPRPGSPVMPPRGPGGPGGGPPGGPYRQRSQATPQHPAGIVPVAQVFDEPPPMPSAPTPGYPGMPGQPQPGGAMPGAVPAVPLANQPGMSPVAPFDPANASDIAIWVHDVTVEPGKTYRYRLKYAIKNPVFGANAACNPATLGDVFVLESEPSEYTKSVSIPNTVIYFAVAAPAVGQDIRHIVFEVFTWTVDGLSKQTVNAFPGDLIDPTLKVSLVDMREKGANIILMDEHGALSTRNVHVDSKSKELDEARKTAAQFAVPLAGR